MEIDDIELAGIDTADNIDTVSLGAPWEPTREEEKYGADTGGC